MCHVNNELLYQFRKGEASHTRAVGDKRLWVQGDTGHRGRGRRLSRLRDESCCACGKRKVTCEDCDIEVVPRSQGTAKEELVDNLGTTGDVPGVLIGIVEAVQAFYQGV